MDLKEKDIELAEKLEAFAAKLRKGTACVVSYEFGNSGDYAISATSVMEVGEIPEQLEVKITTHFQ